MRSVDINSYIIFVLGTGPFQRSIFDILTRSGYCIGTIGPSENIFNAIAHIQSDVREIEFITKEMKKFRYKPLYFFSSQTDITVLPAAILNKFFECAEINIEISKMFTNKFLVRNKNINSIILKNPAYEIIDIKQLENKKHFYAKYPFILKPVSLQSSLGLLKVEINEEVNHTDYVQTLHKLGVSQIIKEEFVEGVEYTVEGYKHKNGFHEILCASRKEKRIGFGIANALNYTPIAKQIVEEISLDLENLFEDYPFGPTHTEVIRKDNGEFYLVESAIRGGGSGIPSDIIPSLTGFSPEFQMIHDSIGMKLHQFQIQRYPYVSLLFFEFKSFCADLIIFDKKKLGNIRVWTDYEAGAEVKKIIDDRSRHGFIIIGARSTSDLNILKTEFLNDNPNITLY